MVTSVQGQSDDAVAEWLCAEQLPDVTRVCVVSKAKRVTLSPRGKSPSPEEDHRHDVPQEVAVTLLCGRAALHSEDEHGVHHYLFPAVRTIGELLVGFLKDPPPTAVSYVENAGTDDCYYLASEDHVPLAASTTLADATIRHGSPSQAPAISLRLVSRNESRESGEESATKTRRRARSVFSQPEKSCATIIGFGGRTKRAWSTPNPAIMKPPQNGATLVERPFVIENVHGVRPKPEPPGVVRDARPGDAHRCTWYYDPKCPKLQQHVARVQVIPSHEPGPCSVDIFKTNAVPPADASPPDFRVFHTLEPVPRRREVVANPQSDHQRSNQALRVGAKVFVPMHLRFDAPYDASLLKDPAQTAVQAATAAFLASVAAVGGARAAIDAVSLLARDTDCETAESENPGQRRVDDYSRISCRETQNAGEDEVDSSLQPADRSPTTRTPEPRDDPETPLDSRGKLSTEMRQIFAEASRLVGRKATFHARPGATHAVVTRAASNWREPPLRLKIQPKIRTPVVSAPASLTSLRLGHAGPSRQPTFSEMERAIAKACGIDANKSSRNKTGP